MTSFEPLPQDAPAVESQIEVRRSMLRGREDQFAPLRQLHLRERLKEIAFFALLFLAGLALNLSGMATANLLLRIIGTLVTSLAINSFVLLMHEGMHFVLFKNRAANRAGSVALGATFLMSYSAYRVLHTRHHRYLGDARDPDDYDNYAGRRGMVWLMQYLRLTVGALAYIFLIPFVAWRYGTSAEHRDMLVEYSILIALYTLMLATLPGQILIFAWFIPLLCTGWLTAMRGLSQHGVTQTRDPYLASRSIAAGAVIRFFMLNENYHLEHHLFPEIPSYHLHAASQLIAPRLPRMVTMNSYLGFLLRFFIQSLRMDETPIGLKQQPKT
jgi:fatty acid desaturase